MAKLRDKLWLWAQSPDAHYETNNTYNLPGHSRMTAAEGAFYFNIPNVCRVRMMGHPMPPYDQESVPLRPCKQVSGLFSVQVPSLLQNGEIQTR